MSHPVTTARMAAIEKTRAWLMEHVGLIPLPGEIPPVPKKKWRKRRW